MKRKKSNWLQNISAVVRRGSDPRTTPRRRRAMFRLASERLESRWTPSCPAEPFVVEGSAGDDTIQIEPAGDSLTEIMVRVNGVVSGPCRPAAAITVRGLEGNDTITVAPGVYLPTILDGGPGEDMITGGSGDDLILVRDAAADTIAGGLGVDRAATDSLDFVSGVEHLNPIPVTAENQPQRVKVLVLNFDPLVPSEGDRRLYEIFNWNDPRTLVAGYEADLERASGGAVDFDIVEWRDINEIPAFEDGFRYTTEQYVQNRRNNHGWHEGRADFPRIAAEQNLAALIDSGAVDEVWHFGDHFFALPGESWMAGPGAFFINGPTYPEVATERAFACMGFSYERGVAEMLHNMGHRTESTMNRIYGGWNLANPTSNWDRFSANHAQSNGVAGVGTTHWPSNAQEDYDTSNTRLVASWADDFLDYPELTGETMLVNRNTWSKGPFHDYERDYQNWYFAHFPRAAGVNADGKQNNWWKYVYDFQNYTESGQPKPLAASARAHDLYHLGGGDYTFAVTYSGATAVNLATIDGNDVRVTGPGGFNQAAELVGASDAFDDTRIVATYRIAAPGGAWDAADFGAYQIHLQADEVRNVTGDALAATILGAFRVRSTAAMPLPADDHTALLLRFDGTLNGAAGEAPTLSAGVNFQPGLMGQAVSNGPAGQVQYAQNGNIDPLRGTIEFWVRPNWNGNTNNQTHVLFEAGQAHSGDNNMILAVDGANNLVLYYAGDNLLTPQVESNVVKGIGHSAANWRAGEWHHVAAAWDSDVDILQIYIDGRPVGFRNSLHSSVRITDFGGSAISLMADVEGTQSAQAMFDEFRISNRARSASEIMADFLAGISLTSLTIDTGPITADAGDSRPLRAIATDAHGAARDVTAAARWSSSHPAAATVSPLAELLAHQAGSATITATLGSLTANVSVTVYDAGGPVGVADAADVTTFGGVEHQFTVTWTDDTAVEVNRLGRGDVRIYGPSGFSTFATLVPAGAINGTPRTATYRFTPPGGFWDAADNGVYRVELLPFQVLDTSANPNRGGVSDTFLVQVPPLVEPLSISDIPHQGTHEDTATAPIAFTLGGVQPPGDWTVSAASSNPALVPVANIALAGAGPNRTVTLTPAADQHGAATITLTASDGGRTVETSFVLTVAPVNDPPTISAIADVATNEDAATAAIAFTVTDVDHPAAALTITAASSNPALAPVGNIVVAGSGANRTVTITPAANLSGAATITLTVSDGAATASEEFVVTVSPVNDAPTISSVADVTIDENGTSAAIPFTLGDIDTALDALTVTASTSSLALTPLEGIILGGSGANRTITITPAPNQHGVATITVSVSDGTETTLESFVVTVNPVNTPPTISAIEDVILNEDAASGALAFTVGDVETAASALTVSASSSNPSLVPPAGIVLGGAGANRTVTITPAANLSGAATVTLTVSDGDATATETFLVTVNPQNDAPTISTVNDVTIDEDGEAGPLAFQVGDVETAPGALTVTASSSDPALIPPGNIVVAGSGANRTVTITPAANLSGAATITLTVSDGAATASEEFVVSVSPVNDAPTISGVADVTIDEDSATGPIPFTIGDIDTTLDALMVSAFSSNGILAPPDGIALGGSGVNRTIMLTPAPNQHGAATITLRVSDGNKSVEETFVLTVAPVNDPPTISAIGDVATNEDAATAAIAFTVTDVDHPAAALTITAASSNPALAPVGNIVVAGSGANRTVTITPAANLSGAATITLTVSDGAATASEEFVVTVSPVNDAPTLMLASSPVVNEDAGPQTVENFLYGVSPGAADEAGQTLSLAVSHDHPALFAAPPAIDLATGRLTFTPAENAHGTATITVTLSDNGEDAAATTVTATITVNSVNDAPTILAPTSGTVNDDAPGASLGAVTVVDPDAGDTHVLTVSDSRWEIVGGVLKLKEGTSLDFETTPAVTITLTATDSGSPPQSVTHEILVTVLDVAEPQRPWQNPGIREDVDGNGRVDPNDLLEIVGPMLAARGPFSLLSDDAPINGPPPYLDVNGDNWVTLADLLDVSIKIRDDRLASFRLEGEAGIAADALLFGSAAPWATEETPPPEPTPASLEKAAPPTFAARTQAAAVSPRDQFFASLIEAPPASSLEEILELLTAD